MVTPGYTPPMTPKVILIGGAPGAGKTTLGRALARELDVASVTCDDLVQAAKGVTTRDSHPDLHALVTGNPIAYFTDSTVEQLIGDVMRQHQGSWPAVERVIRARSTWGAPIVIDGCALQPSLVQSLELANVWSVWLDTARPVLEARERSNPFYSSSRDPEKMLRNFLERSYFYNDFIKDAATACGYTIVHQDGTSSVETLRDLVQRALADPRSARGAPGPYS